MTDLATALKTAFLAGNSFVADTPEGHWYPCGFAWLTYKCRKNAKEAATLKDNGFRWDDYRKEYTLGAFKWKATQSMDYQISIVREVQQSLAESGFPQFGVDSRID